MRKVISLLLAVSLSLGALSLAGCGGEGESGGERLSIVTTIFPVYDWAMQILGERAADADVTMLLDSGVDLHSYQPTADDMVKISTCDVFLYVGGESDEWVEDALRGATNKDMVTVNLLEALGDAAKEEETVEGMEEEEEEGGEESPAYDEHVWLSLRNAKVLVGAIAEALGRADEKGADTYKANAAAYGDRLDALDAKYEAAVSGAARRTLLFGDRFPFRYLADDYGLDYYAAFSGCSAETEASFETVAFLAGKVDELSLPCVLTLEGTDHGIAQAIVEASASKSAKIIALDSMQSTTAGDVEGGASYLAAMEGNLAALQEALS